MTKVVITRSKDGTYRSFSCTGHAGYAEEGEDIVCAGISAIVINTINCLQDLVKEDIACEYAEEGGEIICVFKNPPQEQSVLLIESMIHGLKWIRTQYGKNYLTYNIKEV